MNNQEEKNMSSEQKINQETQAEQVPNFQEPLKKDLTVCKEALAEWQEKCTRLSADFENYKKRMVREQAVWMQSARVSMLSNLMTIVDNFDRAMEYKKNAPSTPMIPDGDEHGAKKWVDGIVMIYTSFQEFLKKMGVHEVPYDHFDPLYHEALVQVVSEQHKPGDIVEVLQKGYMIDDQVIRPAKVSVAK